MTQLRENDQYGRTWTIFETDRSDASSHPEHVPTGWLCFRRDDGHLVRVPRGEYPHDWQTSGSGQLLELIGRGEIPARAD
ncbi:MAG TPA: hypothetical protein VGM82_24635 [Gemmatimonadaceae bacterium]|jgi:hypothetical protein